MRPSLSFAFAVLVAPTLAAQRASAPAPAAPAAPAAPFPERAVRRDIPMTNAIRRAHAAGTRDSSGRPGRNYWQQGADYVIRAALDAPTGRLTGEARITLHNRAPVALDQVVLRLDPNLFRPENPHAAPWVPAQVTDGMVLSRLTVAGRPVRLDGAEPAPGAPAGDWLQSPRSTVARLRLAQPIPARDSAVLEVAWSHILPAGPGMGHRMTQRWGDTLVQPTQWYPRVAMHDDLRGWDTELYLGPSEFHNAFGRFDVTVDVPAGWLVSGTGTLANPEAVLTPETRARLARVTASDSVTVIVGPDETGPGRATAASPTGRLAWRFVADSVNDFAWASASRYVWKATRATIPGRGPVPIHLLHLPGRAALYADAGRRARHALEFYSRLWFSYPFPQLTLQDGPSAGMEYPMVINSNQGAADHETGHQWWPMVVANDETRYGWMDEGFNQYMNILSDADAAGTAPLLDGLGQSYGGISGNEAEPPMMWNANYAGPAFYGFTTYLKTPLMLSALGGVVGDSAVQRAHREFALAWRFKHPSPWDWMFFMERALGRDLGWFWHAWLFTTERPDGAIESVTTAGRRARVTVRQDGQAPAPVVLRVTFAPGGALPALPPDARRVDDRTVEYAWPAAVWFAGSRRFVAEVETGGRAIERIVLDPARRVPDATPEDNAWPRP